MNRAVLLVISLAVALGLTACSKFKTYNGPEVTEIFVFKQTRKMYLMHHDTALAEFDFDLGFAPNGHKEQRGDGRTPEGTYYIDRRNPNSAYHLSVGINYPNEEDRSRAKEAGVNPGGDIFIHGGPTEAKDRGRKDWTAGCIAVTNKEIEDIYAMVREGTPIHIVPANTKVPPDGAVMLTEGVELAAVDESTDMLTLEELAAVDAAIAANPGDSQIVTIGEEVELVGEGDPVE
ncbi:MAG TPA: hypothetical protein DEO85_00345 [Maritimibacter sp.]|nr:hypothetical protein [Maritimibacter sp.]